jgi:hypothetical protein
MACRAATNCRTAIAGVLRDIWRAAEFATAGDKIDGVKVLVAAHSAGTSDIVFDHVERGRTWTQIRVRQHWNEITSRRTGPHGRKQTLKTPVGQALMRGVGYRMTGFPSRLARSRREPLPERLSIAESAIAGPMIAPARSKAVRKSAGGTQRHLLCAREVCYVKQLFTAEQTTSMSASVRRSPLGR